MIIKISGQTVEPRASMIEISRLVIKIMTRASRMEIISRLNVIEILMASASMIEIIGGLIMIA